MLVVVPAGRAAATAAGTVIYAFGAGFSAADVKASVLCPEFYYCPGGDPAATSGAKGLPQPCGDYLRAPAGSVNATDCKSGGLQ